jgi:glycosyltransferase involved in cell wall biosynthesis
VRTNIVNKWWRLEKHSKADQLCVLNFFLLPSWRFNSIRKWNHYRWAAAIAKYLEQQNISIDILWLSSPEHLPFCRKIRSRLVCYDCMDNYESFFPHLLPFEQELFSKADVTFVSASLLQEKARKYTNEVYLVPNGVEVELFRAVLEKSYPLPPDMRNIPLPRIGYYGSIEDWLDYELLEELHKKTGFSIVLIGPVKSKQAKRLARNKQVFLLGPKSYRELPAYLAHFSVCILPFKDTELTRTVDPVKVYEYLAAGKDVIATPLPALSKHEGLLTKAVPAEFCAAVCSILKRVTPFEVRIERSAAMSIHSWEKRAEQIKRTIENKGINAYPSYIGTKVE